MLDVRSIVSAGPDADKVWAVFKEFTTLPVEGVEEGFLYEIGVYGFGAPETFRMNLVRQFSFYEDGEYDRMEQLHCTLHFPPDDDLRALGKFNTWAEQHASLDDFYLAVEQRPEWEIVRRKGGGTLDLSQEQV